MSKRADILAKIAAMAPLADKCFGDASRMRAIRERTGRDFGISVKAGKFTPHEMKGRSYVWSGSPVATWIDALEQIEVIA